MCLGHNQRAPLAETKSTAYVDLGVMLFHTLVVVAVRLAERCPVPQTHPSPGTVTRRYSPSLAVTHHYSHID